MWSSLAVTTLLAIAPEPISCHLQKGADWVGSNGVTAIECDGHTGFFVPSLEFQSIYRESEPYALLERELKLAKLEILELRTAVAISDKSVVFERALNEKIFTSWRAAEQDLLQANSDAERKWWESQTLWFSLGALAATAVVIAR